MGLSSTSKLFLILMIIAYVSSGSVEAWSWSWSSGSSGLGWGSDGSSITGFTSNNHTAPSNNSSITGSTHNNHTAPSILNRSKIEVTVWKSGFDYQEWVSKHAPFYVNDVLVFKYNMNDKTQQSKTKNDNNNYKNDVYLLPDSRSYKRCDVSRGKKLSSSIGGFKLLLRKTCPTYYFVSGDHNYCYHNMKFSLSPLLHLKP